MKNKIIEMLELQDTLNTNTNTSTWREWITPKWKVINWKRCIYMETAEAIDSVTWKHWKNVDWGIDYDNFKVELIDIWHFLMSYLLTTNSIEEVAELTMKFVNEKSEIKLPKILDKESNLIIDDILLPYEELMFLSLMKDDSQEYIEAYIKSFFVCLDSANISFDDLYKLYIGKNVLNKFRQDHWYKEWTYIKMWNGKEDNVYMQEIIESKTWFDSIYLDLENIYKKLK